MAKSAESDRVRAAFAGTDPNRFLDIGDKDFAVADTVGPGGLLDRLDGGLHLTLLENDLDFHLGQEIDDVFRSTETPRLHKQDTCQTAVDG